ncbi:MAG: HAMP domain-containing histidine kinase [Candidatus Thorarchaeota archaeon]|nr:HAMP domain-containing histidine kinase [Candidatus Thorarchaeota archaeon]
MQQLEIMGTAEILGGVVFALVALIGICGFSRDRRYRTWSVSQFMYALVLMVPDTLHYDAFLLPSVRLMVQLMAALLLFWAFYHHQAVRRGILIQAAAILILSCAMTLIVSVAALPPTILVIPAALVTSVAAVAVARVLFQYPGPQPLLHTVSAVVLCVWSAANLPFLLMPFLDVPAIFGGIQYVTHLAVTAAMLLSSIELTKSSLERELLVTHTISSILTHDLRSFLNIASGALELAEDSGTKNMKPIATARDALDAASRFMNETRTALVSLAPVSPVVEACPVTEIVSRLVERVRAEHRLDEDSLTVRGCVDSHDRVSPIIGQALWNIIDNGIRHAVGRPSIVLECVAGDAVTFRISDNAGGLPVALKRALNEGGQVPNASRMGLVLVREIARVFDADLSVDDIASDGRVVGSVFTLKVPKVP